MAENNYDYLWQRAVDPRALELENSRETKTVLHIVVPYEHQLKAEVFSFFNQYGKLTVNSFRLLSMQIKRYLEHKLTSPLDGYRDPFITAAHDIFLDNVDYTTVILEYLEKYKEVSKDD